MVTRRDISPRVYTVPPPEALARLARVGGCVSLPDPDVIPTGTDSAAVGERWRMRDALRGCQPYPQQRRCGVQPIGSVYIGAGWQRGTATCKSVHACPVCSGRLRALRADEIHDAVCWWAEQDGCVGLLSLTVRHQWGGGLRRLRRGLTAAWRELWHGRPGERLRDFVAHYIRGLDVTWGPNGWHPHLHALLFFRDEPRPDWLQAVRERWAGIVACALGESARPRTDSIGVHYSHKPTRATYLAKLGCELSDIATKRAGSEHLTPWAIGHRAIAEYRDGQACGGRELGYWRRLWTDWVQGMHGARHLTWSRALRRAMHVQDEPEQLPDDPVPELTGEPWLLSIRSSDWRGALGRLHMTPGDLWQVTLQGPEQTARVLRRAGLRCVWAERRALGPDGQVGWFLIFRSLTVAELLDHGIQSGPGPPWAHYRKDPEHAAFRSAGTLPDLCGPIPGNRAGVRDVSQGRSEGRPLQWVPGPAVAPVFDCSAR